MSALTGQSLVSAGVLAQDATTQTSGRSAALLRGIAGEGATVAAVGDGQCLTPGGTLALSAGTLDLSHLQIVQSTVLQGLDQQVQTALKPVLDPVLGALQGGLQTGLRQLGDPGLFVGLGAVESRCTAAPGTAPADATLAGVGAYVQVGGQRVDLLSLPVHPAPNTKITTGLGDVAARGGERPAQPAVHRARPGRSARWAAPSTRPRCSTTCSPTSAASSRPLDQNVLSGTLNRQVRPAAGAIEVTALYLDVLPAAAAFGPAAAVGPARPLHLRSQRPDRAGRPGQAGDRAPGTPQARSRSSRTGSRPASRTATTRRRHPPAGAHPRRAAGPGRRSGCPRLPAPPPPWLRPAASRRPQRRDAARRSWSSSSAWSRPGSCCPAATRRSGRRTARWSAAAPVRLKIAALHLDAAVVPVQVSDDAVLDPPGDYREVGWWTGSAKPGAGSGQTVMTGHTVHTGGGSMDHIGRLRPGRRSTSSPGAARCATRSATCACSAPRPRSPAPRVRLFGQRHGGGRLVLVSCTDWNGSSYDSNVVVLGDPLGVPEPSAHRDHRSS